MPAKVVIILLVKKKKNRINIYIYISIISLPLQQGSFWHFGSATVEPPGFWGLRAKALGSQLCQQQGVTLIKSLGTLGWVEGDPAQQLLGVGSPSSSQNTTCLSFPNHHSQFCAIGVALPCQNLIETGF